MFPGHVKCLRNIKKRKNWYYVGISVRFPDILVVFFFAQIGISCPGDTKEDDNYDRKRKKSNYRT